MCGVHRKGARKTEKVFLLSEADEKYFIKTEQAINKNIANRQRISGSWIFACLDLFYDKDVTAEEKGRVLCEIKRNLPYKPENIIKRWEKISKTPYFSFMHYDTPAASSEPEGVYTFELLTDKGNKKMRRNWLYCQSDKADGAFFAIESLSNSAMLLSKIGAGNRLEDAENIEALREALELPNHAYIPIFKLSAIQGLISVCNAVKAINDAERAESAGEKFSAALESLPYFGKDFATIRQGVGTNALTKLRDIQGKNTAINPVTGEATIKTDKIICTISDYAKIAGLKTSTHQLLDALTVALTDSGAKTPVVALSLEEYMDKRGLKDRKEARKQAIDDLETLYNATISFKQNRKNGPAQDFHDIRIIDSKGIRNGVINVSFGTAFYNILKGYTVMPYPVQLWRLNGKRNPNSFYFLRKISEQKNMNPDKKSEDIIAVKTLLECTPCLPTYEEVMSEDRHLGQRIIKPFERDMDAINDVLTWHYCHSNNQPLTDKEISNLTYDVFKDLYIFTEWLNYPDQSDRLQRKAERIEAAKEKKAASKKKQPKE